jgi:hypothetical protein
LLVKTRHSGRAVLLVALACAQAACDPAASTRAPPQVAPATTTAAPAVAPSAGAPATPAAPRWLQVTEDELPYLTSPKNRGDKIEALLPAGMLIEPRTLEVGDENADVRNLALDVQWSHRQVVRKGAVRPIRQSGDTLGWTFADAVTPGPSVVPDRETLCQALAQATPPAFSVALCKDEAKFVVLAGPDRPRLLGVWGDLSTQASLFVTLDLQALAAGKPAIVDRLPSVALIRVRQVAAPGGHTVVWGEQYFRKGNETGGETVLWVIAPDGRKVQQLAFPQQTSEPAAGVVRQRTGTVTVTQGPNGPRFRVERVEFQQDLVTGRESGRQQKAEEAVWRGATSRFEVIAL